MMPTIQARPEGAVFGRTTSRRAFLRGSALAGAALTLGQSFPRAQVHRGPFGEAAPDVKPDYSLEIAEIEWELAPKKKIRTTAYNGQIPGPLLRVTEGKPVSIGMPAMNNRPAVVNRPKDIGS